MLPPTVGSPSSKKVFFPSALDSRYVGIMKCRAAGVRGRSGTGDMVPAARTGRYRMQVNTDGSLPSAREHGLFLTL